MTKKAYYFPNPRKLLIGLAKDMAQKQIQHTNRQIKDIVSQRKERLKSIYLSKSHEIIQPTLQCTKNAFPEFSSMSPIAAQQPFISQKIKENILRPQRFYSRQPNMKAGSFSEGKRNLVEKEIIISRKFEEYSRIVDNQSGVSKMEKLNKLMSERRQLLDDSNLRYSRMKKTYFQKFMADKYNFYTKPTKVSIGGDSSSVKKSRTKVLTISETSFVGLKKESATASPKESKTHLQADLLAQVGKCSNKSMVARSRIKTQSNHKNLESLE